MKKKFSMQNLDCANCARKMEEGIKKLPGVQSCSISFMTQKITLEANEEDFANVLEEARKVCKKVDSDCKIVE